jgi:hypothetical protein
MNIPSLHCLTFELRFLITPSNHFYYFMKCFRDRLSFCLFFFSSLYCLSSDCLFKQSGELGCSGRVRCYCCTSNTRHVTVNQHEHHLAWTYIYTVYLFDLRITVSDYPFKQSLVCLCVVFFRSLCVLLSFVMSSVLQFTTSDYPFILSFQQKMLQ